MTYSASPSKGSVITHLLAHSMGGSIREVIIANSSVLVEQQSLTLVRYTCAITTQQFEI